MTTDGGQDPHWRKDGRELFFINGAADALVSVSVAEVAGVLEFSAPTKLFDVRFPGVSRTRYAVSGDGQRFYPVTVTAAAEQRPVRVVTDWPAFVTGDR